MFGRKKGPDKAFSHTDDCKIAKVTPDVKIPWNEVESGHWVATCQCGEQHHREPFALPSRLDPLDPAHFRHAPQCEHRDTTAPDLIRAIVKVVDGMGGDYWWSRAASAIPPGRFRTTPRRASVDEEPAAAPRPPIRAVVARPAGAVRGRALHPE
jgi:hypothetical protein